MTVAAARRNVGGMNEMQNARRAAHLDCQVLVVGAGPTGLVLAADLLARKVAVRIIDKGHGAALETRAVAVHARAMEVLDLMGLADRFIERGQIVRRFTFYTDGRRRLSLEMARNGSRFGFMLDIPQHDTESLLRAAQFLGHQLSGAPLEELPRRFMGVPPGARERLEVPASCADRAALYGAVSRARLEMRAQLRHALTGQS